MTHQLVSIGKENSHQGQGSRCCKKADAFLVQKIQPVRFSPKHGCQVCRHMGRCRRNQASRPFHNMRKQQSEHGCIAQLHQIKMQRPKQQG